LPLLGRAIFRILYLQADLVYQVLAKFTGPGGPSPRFYLVQARSGKKYGHTHPLGALATTAPPSRLRAVRQGDRCA
jgi:hypothetical protein